MGLTKNSTGNKLLKNKSKDFNNDNVIALLGNPNVGKSTIFNALTGLNQHTGNWTGKTISSAHGNYEYNKEKFTIVDLPGTYSIFSFSPEEEVTRNFICFKKHKLTLVILDATALERNLNLALQAIETNDNILVIVNLMDEAKKKGIVIDLNKLSNILEVPVIGVCANKKKCINKIKEKIKECMNNKSNNNFIKYDDIIENVINKINLTLIKFNINKNNRFIAVKLLENNKILTKQIFKSLKLNKEEINELEKIVNYCIYYLRNNDVTNYEEIIVNKIIRESEKISKEVVKKEKKRNFKFDKLLTSKYLSFPIMLFFLIFILWLTIFGSNYPSKLLSTGLNHLNDLVSKTLIFLKFPKAIHDLIVNGVLKTLFWVVSVMLPPMAIFFPLFTLLEDAGFLPRIAFNVDKLFRKSNCHGKQSLTMCMGLGCNACGVVGCRIIDSPKERLIAILTNNFIPCNGRFPSLIAIIIMFFVTSKFSSLKASLLLMICLLFAIVVTLIVSKILSKTLLKGIASSFVLEIPSFRKPQIGKVIVRSIFDRTLFVLGRAICVALPAGILIWVISNIKINNYSILNYCTDFLNPIANMFGMDGTILMAFILGFPANEIVIPIILMSYLNTSMLTDYNSLFDLKKLLINNGWTSITALCTLIFTMFHFPCSTTLLTIKKETRNNKWTLISFLLPTIVGLLICFLINIIAKIVF